MYTVHRLLQTMNDRIGEVINNHAWFRDCWKAKEYFDL